MGLYRRVDDGGNGGGGGGFGGDGRGGGRNIKGHNFVM